MAGSKSFYLSEKILDHVLGGVTYTPVATVYIALSSAAFDPNAAGGFMNELPSTGGYARVAVGNNGASWSGATAAAPSVKTNSNDIIFPTATASWGTPLSAYIMDAATIGNVLYGADITTPSAVNTGDTFAILAGTFIITED